MSEPDRARDLERIAAEQRRDRVRAEMDEDNPREREPRRRSSRRDGN